MKDQNSRGTAQLGVGKQIILHLGPGLLAAGVTLFIESAQRCDPESSDLVRMNEQDR